MRLYRLAMLVLITATGCVHEPFSSVQPAAVQDNCPAVAPLFNKDIRPIFASSCAKSGCHDGTTMPLDFSVYDNIKHYLDDSAVYYSVIINHTMPEDHPLDSVQFSLLKCWLKSGHPDN